MKNIQPLSLINGLFLPVAETAFRDYLSMCEELIEREPEILEMVNMDLDRKAREEMPTGRQRMEGSTYKNISLGGSGPRRDSRRGVRIKSRLPSDVRLFSVYVYHGKRLFGWYKIANSKGIYKRIDNIEIVNREQRSKDAWLQHDTGTSKHGKR